MCCQQSWNKSTRLEGKLQYVLCILYLTGCRKHSGIRAAPAVDSSVSTLPDGAIEERAFEEFEQETDVNEVPESEVGEQEDKDKMDE